MAIALVSAAVVDRVSEISLAAATVLAAVAVVFTLPALLRRPRGRSRLTPALVIVTGGAAITFVAWLAFTVRCTQSGCHIHPGDDIAGLQPWWRAKGSWQWAGQLALASVGLLTASLALVLAARGRRGARGFLIAARAAYATWALVAFLLPAAWEVFVI